MPALNWLDYCIIATIGLSGLVGMIRGVIREVFSLVSWVLAVWLALRFGGDVGAYLENLIPMPPVRSAAAFAIVFFGVLLALGLVGLLLETVVERTGLSGADRLLGLFFGIARGVLVVAVLVLLASLTPLPAESWWKSSQLVPAFQSIALWLRDQIPPDLADRLRMPDTLRR